MITVDDGVKAAMIIVAAYLIKLAFEALGFPLTDELYNTLAAIIVAALLGLFGYQVVRAIAFKAGAGRFFK